MKKIYLLLIACLSITAMQAQNFTKVWTKFCNGTDFTWFNTAANPAPGFINATTAIAYNPVTNKVLVGNRQDSIYILNATTGAQEGTLPMGGDIGPEAFKFNKIRCTSDGVIYAISLATGANPAARIYRWADQTTAPFLCATFATTERCGDAFALSGSGTSTVLYASGAALASVAGPNTKVYVFTTNNGTSFLNTATIDVPSGTSQWVNRAIDPAGATPTAGLWTDMSGGPARRLTITGSAPTLSATVGYTTTTGYNAGQVADAYCGMRYLQTPGNRKYVAFSGANNAGDGVTMRLLEVTNEADVKTVGTDTLYSAPNVPWVYQTNANGTGDVAFKANGNGSYDIFYLATNNAISCVRTATTLPVELASFQASLKGNTVNLNWATSNEINNDGFSIEKSLNGEKFTSIGYVKSKTNNAGAAYNFVDEKVGDKVSKIYYRLKQVDKDGKFNYSNIEAINIPLTKGFGMQAFENPITNEIKLAISASKDAKITFNISNSIGQILSTKEVSVKAGVNNISLPTSQFKSGMLFILATDGVNKQTLSVIKN